jgi:hypothetical protein
MIADRTKAIFAAEKTGSISGHGTRLNREGIKHASER